MTAIALVVGVGLVLAVFVALSAMMASTGGWIEVAQTWAFALTMTAAIVAGIWLVFFGVTGEWPT